MGFEEQLLVPGPQPQVKELDVCLRRALQLCSCDSTPCHLGDIYRPPLPR